MPFRFPGAKFVSNSIARQFCHVVSEVFEVAKAVLIERDAEAALVECFDVIHAVETLIRIIANRFNLSPEAAKNKVLSKNAERGYYGIYNKTN